MTSVVADLLSLSAVWVGGSDTSLTALSDFLAIDV